MPDGEIVPGVIVEAGEAARIAAELLGTTPPEQETPAAEEVATAAGETPVTESEPTAQGDAAVEGDGKPKQDPVEEFIAKKYGGDRSKFVEGLWNLQNSGAANYKELQELKKILSERLPEKAHDEPAIDPLETTDDGTWLKQQLTAVDSGIAEAQSEQQHVLQGLAALRERTAEIRGELKKADDFDKSALRQELAQVQTQLTGAEDRWRSLEREKGRSSMEKQRIALQIKKLQTDFREQQQATKLVEAQNKREAAQFVDEFRNVSDAVCEANGIPQNSKLRGLIYNAFVQEAQNHWSSNGLEKLDAKTFISAKQGHVLEDVLGLVNEAKAFVPKAAKAAPGKPAATSTTTAKPLAAAKPLPQAPTKSMTREEALAFRRRIMGG